MANNLDTIAFLTHYNSDPNFKLVADAIFLKNAITSQKISTIASGKLTHADIDSYTGLLVSYGVIERKLIGPGDPNNTVTKRWISGDEYSNLVSKSTKTKSRVKIDVVLNKVKEEKKKIDAENIRIQGIINKSKPKIFTSQYDTVNQSIRKLNAPTSIQNQFLLKPDNPTLDQSIVNPFKIKQNKNLKGQFQRGFHEVATSFNQTNIVPPYSTADIATSMAMSPAVPTKPIFLNPKSSKSPEAIPAEKKYFQETQSNPEVISRKRKSILPTVLKATKKSTPVENKNFESLLKVSNQINTSVNKIVEILMDEFVLVTKQERRKTESRLIEEEVESESGKLVKKPSKPPVKSPTDGTKKDATPTGAFSYLNETGGAVLGAGAALATKGVVKAAGVAGRLAVGGAGAVGAAIATPIGSGIALALAALATIVIDLNEANNIIKDMKKSAGEVEDDAASRIKQYQNLQKVPGQEERWKDLELRARLERDQLNHDLSDPFLMFRTPPSHEQREQQFDMAKQLRILNEKKRKKKEEGSTESQRVDSTLQERDRNGRIKIQPGDTSKFRSGAFKDATDVADKLLKPITKAISESITKFDGVMAKYKYGGGSTAVVNAPSSKTAVNVSNNATNMIAPLYHRSSDSNVTNI